MRSMTDAATAPSSGVVLLPPVCIVGGGGRMGAMLTRELALAGHAVQSVDREPDAQGRLALLPETLDAALAVSRAVLVCVPVSVLPQVLEQLVPHLRPGHLLMDITSVKMLPMQWMEEAFPGPVIGCHPLFGPEPHPDDKRVALVRGRKAEPRDCLQAEALFQRLGCSAFWTTAREHDEGVAFAQSLNFASSAAFFCALARHGNIRPFLTPSFKRHLEAARKHLTQDKDMFVEFSAMNPAFTGVLEHYRDILAEAASGNLAAVADQAASWYGEGEGKEKGKGNASGGQRGVPPLGPH